jgi:S-methylmethionine-dependent homocysteine/selenocysteine methylase
VGGDDLWGTWALYRAHVLDVHRGYARTGCHVISTETWSILSVPVEARNWMDLARSAVRLARQAIDEAGRCRAGVALDQLSRTLLRSSGCYWTPIAFRRKGVEAPC